MVDDPKATAESDNKLLRGGSKVGSDGKSILEDVKARQRAREREMQRAADGYKKGGKVK